MFPSPALITPRSDNSFPNILATNVSNNIGRYATCCSFASFLIVSLIPFINKLNYLSDLIIFIIFLVVPFSKIALFSKDLITFIIYCISLFVRVIPGKFFL